MQNRDGLLTVILRWLPSLAIMLIIFFVSSRPSTDLPDFGALELVIEIGGHMLAYGLLALSLSCALGPHEIRNLGLAAILAFLYAVSDEMHQSYVPGRDASFFDLEVDVLGIFLGLSTKSILHKTAKK